METHQTQQLRNNERIVAVAVDVQNDFCPGGALAVENGDAVIAPLNQLFAWTEQQGGLTVATRDWHPPQTPHFADYGGTWPVHCVADTDGAQLHKDLAITDKTIILDKGLGDNDGYSGYDGGGPKPDNMLEKIVQPHHAEEHVRMYIGGLATDYCVRATVLDALKQAERIRATGQGVLHVYAVTDAMRGVNLQPHDSDHALQQMAAAGATHITMQEIMEQTA